MLLEGLDLLLVVEELEVLFPVAVDHSVVVEAVPVALGVLFLVVVYIACLGRVFHIQYLHNTSLSVLYTGRLQVRACPILAESSFCIPTTPARLPCETN